MRNPFNRRLWIYVCHTISKHANKQNTPHIGVLQGLFLQQIQRIYINSGIDPFDRAPLAMERLKDL